MTLHSASKEEGGRRSVEASRDGTHAFDRTRCSGEKEARTTLRMEKGSCPMEIFFLSKDSGEVEQVG